MEPTFPVAIYEPPSPGFPFIGAVQLPGAELVMQVFPTRQEAVHFTEDAIRNRMLPRGERKSS